MRVFVINLKRSKDRQARMKQALDSLGVSFDFFEGTDGKELQKNAIDLAYDEARVKKNLNRVLSINEIGCTISHRAVYKKIVDEGIEKACILEDDIILDRQFADVLSYLDRSSFPNTVVKLDNYQEKTTPCSVWNQKRVIHGYFFKKPVTTQWMAWGYVIDRSAAASILAAWPKIEFMSDDWKRMSKAVRIRCVQPAVVHQNVAVESVIDEDRKDLLAGFGRSKGRVMGFGRAVHIAKTLIKMMLP